MQSMISSNPYENANGILHKTRTNNSKICMEPWKTSHNQSNLEKRPKVPDLKEYYAVVMKTYKFISETE